MDNPYVVLDDIFDVKTDHTKEDKSIVLSYNKKKEVITLKTNVYDFEASIHLDARNFVEELSTFLNDTELLKYIGTYEVNRLKAEIRQLKEENLLLQIRISALQHIRPDISNRGK